MKKQVLSMLLSFITFFSIFQFNAFAEEQSVFAVSLPHDPYYDDKGYSYQLTGGTTVTGNVIVAEARKWVNGNYGYESPNFSEYAIAVRTGYNSEVGESRVTFDCSGFVARILNDVGFRGDTGNGYSCVLRTKYGSGFMPPEIGYLMRYGTDVSSALQKAQNNHDYNSLQAGDLLAWSGNGSAPSYNHIVIYSGNGNMIEFYGAGNGAGKCVERSIETSGYLPYFMSATRLCTTNTSSYLDRCSLSSSYLTIKATKTTYVKSLPCSKDTDSSSKDVAKLSSGDIFNVTGMYKNTANRYWYKGTTNDGKAGYVFSGDFSITSYRSSITYSGKQFPSTLTVGDPYNVDWTINSDYLNLSTISGYIYGGSNLNEVKYSGSLSNVNTTSKGLGNTAVDNELLFNKLSAGTYKMVITATAINYYCTDGTTLSSKPMSATPISFVFTESAGSTIISDTTPPTIHTIGVSNITSTSYTIGLTATDDNFMKEVLMPSWEVGQSNEGVEWTRAAQNEYSFRCTINRSPGKHWVTDVYAFDTSGNASTARVFVRDCIVSFNANGGVVDTANKTVYSVLINDVQQNTYGELPIPTRSGYRFDGWTTDSGEHITEYSKASHTDEITLYAAWTNNTIYTVTYDANGGNSNTVPDPQIKREGQSITLSETEPKRPEYSFVGWAITPNATTAAYQPGDTFSIDANITLYAVWKNQWVIAFNGNGGEGLPALLVVDGETGVIPKKIPVYNGHRFLGWSLVLNAEQADYQPGDNVTPTSNIMLHAIWTKVYTSDWSETRPVGVKDELIETKTQYRYSTKETTTDTASSKEGWTLAGSQQVWGDYGAWSEWSLDAVTESDTRQVETTALYRYYYYYCSANCGRHEPYSGYCDCGAPIVGFSIKWSPIPYNQSNPVSCDNRKMYTTSLGDNQRWNFSSGNLNSSAIGTKDVESDATVINKGYRYRTRTANTVYTFYRWTNWSDWSDTPVEESDSVRVETRTLYRCVIGVDRILILPSALTKIESESFVGIAADAVVIPESVQSIADDAFDAGVVIIGKPNSYAQLYAGWNELTFIPADGQNE